MKEWGNHQDTLNGRTGGYRRLPRERSIYKYMYFPSLSCQRVHKSLMLIIIHTESEGDVAGVFETHETSLLEQHQRNKLYDLSVTIMYEVLYVGGFSQVLKENGDLSVQNRPLSSFLASVIPVKTHATSSGNP